VCCRKCGSLDDLSGMIIAGVSYLNRVVLLWFAAIVTYSFAAFGTAGIVQDMRDQRQAKEAANEAKQVCVFENPMNQANLDESGMQPLDIDENRSTISDPAASELRKLCKIANQGVVSDRWTSVVVTRQFIL